ncbi:Leucine--tRNA ligase 1 [Bienertia sinuspersici]
MTKSPYQPEKNQLDSIIQTDPNSGSDSDCSTSTSLESDCALRHYIVLQVVLLSYGKDFGFIHPDNWCQRAHFPSPCWQRACVESVFRVMPLTSQAVDALGVVTISLVGLLVLFGLFCIIYTLYFRARIQRSALRRLGYFNGPWIVRILFIVFGICWGFGEVVRLSFFRQEGKIFHSLSRKWQEDICKLYILTNLGFTEPCLFLTMSFLLRASLKWRGSGILSQRWNFKTIGYILLYCLPVFILDLIVVVVSPKFRRGKIDILKRLPDHFTSAYLPLSVSGQPVACTYPLLCTMLHGLFAIILAAYLLFLGDGWLCRSSTKVLARHEHFLFEALAFSGFLVLFSCVVVGIFMLVFLPVKDSLALNRGTGMRGAEGGTFYPSEDYADSLSLVAANQTSTATSLGETPMSQPNGVLFHSGL